jgi:hypothetical protein
MDDEFGWASTSAATFSNWAPPPNPASPLVLGSAPVPLERALGSQKPADAQIDDHHPIRAPVKSTRGFRLSAIGSRVVNVDKH